jgi:hypothetical protein
MGLAFGEFLKVTPPYGYIMCTMRCFDVELLRIILMNCYLVLAICCVVHLLRIGHMCCKLDTLSRRVQYR